MADVNDPRDRPELHRRRRRKVEVVLPPAQIPLADSGLSLRTVNALERREPPVVTLGQLALLSEEELANCHNFGQKTLVEVRELLVSHGLRKPPRRNRRRSG